MFARIGKDEILDKLKKLDTDELRELFDFLNKYLLFKKEELSISTKIYLLINKYTLKKIIFNKLFYPFKNYSFKYIIINFKDYSKSDFIKELDEFDENILIDFYNELNDEPRIIYKYIINLLNIDFICISWYNKNVFYYRYIVDIPDIEIKDQLKKILVKENDGIDDKSLIENQITKIVNFKVESIDLNIVKMLYLFNGLIKLGKRTDRLGQIYKLIDEIKKLSKDIDIKDNYLVSNLRKLDIDTDLDKFIDKYLDDLLKMSGGRKIINKIKIIKGVNY